MCLGTENWEHTLDLFTKGLAPSRIMAFDVGYQIIYVFSLTHAQILSLSLKP